MRLICASERQNAFGCRLRGGGFAPDPVTRASAPGPCWGLRPGVCRPRYRRAVHARHMSPHFTEEVYAYVHNLLQTVL